jgi:hypothetical protein
MIVLSRDDDLLHLRLTNGRTAVDSEHVVTTIVPTSTIPGASNCNSLINSRSVISGIHFIVATQRLDVDHTLQMCRWCKETYSFGDAGR